MACTGRKKVSVPNRKASSTPFDSSSDDDAGWVPSISKCRAKSKATAVKRKMGTDCVEPSPSDLSISLPVAGDSLTISAKGKVKRGSARQRLLSLPLFAAESNQGSSYCKIRYKWN